MEQNLATRNQGTQVCGTILPSGPHTLSGSKETGFIPYFVPRSRTPADIHVEIGGPPCRGTKKKRGEDSIREHIPHAPPGIEFSSSGSRSLDPRDSHERKRSCRLAIAIREASNRSPHHQSRSCSRIDDLARMEDARPLDDGSNAPEACKRTTTD